MNKQPLEERIALLLVLQAAQELGTPNAREIAELLGISHPTVRNHWETIKDMLDAGTSHEALDVARQRKLVYVEEEGPDSETATDEK